MDTQPPVTPAVPGLLAQNALPAPSTVTATTAIVRPAAPKHFLAVFFLSFFLGVFGADRFYLGQYVQGALKLLTFGWLGIGAIVDLALVMNGAMRTRDGQPLAGYEEYKGFAKKTVMWITIGAAIFIVANGVLLFVGIESAVSSFKSSSVSNILGGGGGSSSGGSTGTGDPDLDSLISGSGL